MALLDDLDPRWITAGSRHGIGLSFICPSCSDRVMLLFTNPLDGGPPVVIPGALGWTREGSSFETISLVPLIDAGHWVGAVTAGRLTSLTEPG